MKARWQPSGYEALSSVTDAHASRVASVLFRVMMTVYFSSVIEVCVIHLFNVMETCYDNVVANVILL